MGWLGSTAAGEPGFAQRQAMRLASRHSRLVDLLRFVLPAIALVLIALVVLWPRIMGGYGSLIMPMLQSDRVVDVDSMRMQQPRYVGQTRNAEAYAVTAETAVMDPARPNRIHLDHLAADLARTGQGDLHLVALEGVYHRGRERLDLDGGIELTTSDGYRFETRSAQVHLNQGRVIGRQPVSGSGPAGSLAAERFEIREGGAVLRFEGSVRVTLPPSSGGGPSS